MRRHIAPTALTFIAGAGVIIAFAQDQAQPRFDVASVKQGGAPQALTGGPGTSDPDRITYGGGLLRLIPKVYGVDYDQISGAPGWLASEAYLISVIVPRGATPEQVRIMWQNLLADRFDLKVHFVQKEFTVYELSSTKDGPKLREAGKGSAKQEPGFPVPAPGAHRAMSIIPPRTVRLTFRDTSIAEFIDRIGWPLGSLGDAGGFSLGRIADKTGLDGRYDFTFEFAGYMGAGGAFPPPLPEGQTDTALPLFDALRQQLGLKLEEKKVRLDVLVIDHVNRIPTEN